MIRFVDHCSRTRRYLFRVVGSVMACCIVVVGCSGGSSDSAGKAKATSAVADRVDLHVADRFSATPLQPEQEQVIAAALDRLIAGCMSKAGFDYKVSPTPLPPAAPDPYVDADAIVRSTYGADFGAQLRYDKEMSDSVKVHSESLPPADKLDAYHRALHGPTQSEMVTSGDQTTNISGEGCYGKSVEQIYGSIYNLEWLSSISEVGGPSGVSKRLGDIPAYAEARAKWQTCMRASGVDWMDGYKSWAEWDSGYYVLESRMYQEDRAPSSAEVEKIAADDVRCLGSSGLGEIRAKNIQKVRLELWERSDFTEGQKWKLQQYAFDQARKVA